MTEEATPTIAPEIDQQAVLTAALIKAGADEARAQAMGSPFPGIICATLRDHARDWSGPRKSFIATVAMAGFNQATAATQWQRVKKEG